jgi:hypothetical protein
MSGAGCGTTGSSSSQIEVFGTSCRATFNSTTSMANMTFAFRINGVYDGTLSNLILVPASWESALDGGDLFNPDYISILQSERPRVLRFLNYTGANGQVIANFGDMRTDTNISWSSDHFRKELWAGSTGGTTTAYTATLAGLTYVEGATIQLKFNATNTACLPCTINVNSLGDVPLRQQGTTLVTAAGTLTANSLWTCVYNTVLSSGSFVCANSGLGDFAPISVMAGIANAAGTDAWVTMSAMGTLSYFSSYISAMKAAVTKSSWFEYGNEIWNSQFKPTSYVRAMGDGLGWGASSDEDLHSYYGLRARQIEGLIESAYGGATNYRRVIMWQMADSSGITGNVAKYRLKGTSLNGASFPTYCGYVGGSYSGGVCTGDPGYNNVGNRPFDHSDYGGYAVYYYGANLQDLDVHYVLLETSSSGSAYTYTITAASNTNPIQFTTSATLTTPSTWASNQRVALSALAGGTWSTLNSTNQTVTIVDSTHFTIPVDGTGLGTYTASSGRVQRYADDMVAITSAADQWALGNYSTANAAVDTDIRSGTNYGVSSGGINQATLTNFNGSGTVGNYTAWNNTVADATWTNGQKIVTYEAAMQAKPPAASTCTTLDLDARFGNVGLTYCGNSGKIANMLGVGTSADANSYKRSTLFQATVTCQWNQQLAFSKTLYLSWYQVAASDQWSQYTGDIYSNAFTSYAAAVAFPTSGTGSPGC